MPVKSVSIPAGLSVRQVEELVRLNKTTVPAARAYFAARVESNGADTRSGRHAQAWIDAHKSSPAKSAPAKAAKRTPKRTPVQVEATRRFNDAKATGGVSAGYKAMKAYYASL